MGMVFTEQQVLSVSELNNRARDLLEEIFPNVVVEGEVSNLATPASGHIYFSLKDAKSSVRCAMFRSRNRRLDFSLENGTKVQAAGKLSLYAPRGDYQLIANDLRLAGSGNLHQKFEQLKKKLHTEGLFARQLPLPRFPTTIGVITSPHGAAIRDVLSVLNRRCPNIKVIIYPCPVQGTEAAPGIINMLQAATERSECEVLLLVRGGGSIEDLQAFNEESVARAMASCPIPMVSGVGHEVDFSICDFVADLRAATPSAAAESVSPEQTQLKRRVADCQKRIFATATMELKNKRQAANNSLGRLKTPEAMLQTMHQRIDELQQRISSTVGKSLHSGRTLLTQYQRQLRTPDIQRYRNAINLRQRAIGSAFWQGQRLRMAKLENLERTLQAMSPDKVMDRGYAMAMHNDKAIESADELKAKDKITLLLRTGGAHCTVDETFKKR